MNSVFKRRYFISVITVLSNTYGYLQYTTSTTCAQLFERTTRQFEKLFNRQAFLESYKKESIFRENLDEFEASRDVVDELVAEYRAASGPDYLLWPALPATTSTPALAPRTWMRLLFLIHFISISSAISTKSCTLHLLKYELHLN